MQLEQILECKKAVIPHPVRYKLNSDGTSIINYYRCSKAYSYGPRTLRPVWDLVLSLLRDPDRLRAALEKLIEEERRAHQGDPERLAELEGDKAAVLETYSDKASEGLEYFTPEERHQAYKKLRLAILVHPGGDLEVIGVLRQVEKLATIMLHPEYRAEKAQ